MYFSVVFKVLDFWMAISIYFNKKILYEDLKYRLLIRVYCLYQHVDS